MEKNVIIKFENSTPASIPVKAIIGIDINELPAEGTTGYFVQKTDTGYELAAVIQLPAEGITGYFVQKTDTGYELAAVIQVPEFALLANGNYQLTILDGAASWTLIA